MKKILLCMIAILISACSLSTEPEDNANNNTQKIPVPGAVTISVTSLSSITVSWNPVLGAASYSVFRSQSGEADSFSRVKVTREASWTDTGLTAGTTYYYQVSAALHNAGEGERSTVVSACPMLPPAPGNVTAEVLSASGIVIRWDASLSADTYTIYRKDSAGDDYSVLQTELTALTYTDSNVAMGNEYYYKVAGVNQFGEGALSRYTFAVIAVPPVPAGIIGTALSESEIIVSWNAVSGASTYKLYRADNSDGSFTLINTINAPDVTYTDTSLEPVTEYFYCVSAVNGIGESEQSTVASTVTKISPPETINASPGLESSISVSWTEVDEAIDYKLYRSTNADGPYELAATTADLFYSDTVSDITQTYYYKVSAMTINGESAQSIYAGVSFTVPNSPSGLNAVPLSTTSLSISWDTVPGASGYKLYQSTTTPTGEYSLIATVDTITYTHGNLTANTDYFYKVSATNTIGEGESSAYITAKIVPPATPVNVRIESISHNSLRISWDPVPGAWLYSIYRGTSNGGESNVNATSDAYYIDSGLDPFRRYYYRVSANNDIGASPLSTRDISAYTQPIPLEEGKVLASTSVAPSYSSYYHYFCFQVDGERKYYIQGSSDYSSFSFSAYWNNTPSIVGLSISLFQNQPMALKGIEVPKSGYVIISVHNRNIINGFSIQFYKEQA